MDAVKVIAEPRRQEILRLCWTAERSAGDLAAAFDVTFGAVSQHLKVLRDAGLVTVRHAGTRRFYRADRAALGPLATRAGISRSIVPFGAIDIRSSELPG